MRILPILRRRADVAAACKTGGVRAVLREIAREFGRGETTLAALRSAASSEPFDRHLAQSLLRAIGEFEASGRTTSPQARIELRERVKELAPARPGEEDDEGLPPLEREWQARGDPAAAMYQCGIRGQQGRPR